MVESEKKIITDDNWKAQAQKEKEELREKEEKQKKTGKDARMPGTLPPPTFDELVNMFALQAMMYLGKLAPPGEEKSIIDLELAKHHIDMLEVIANKTKGNLTEAEQKGLSLALDQMRWLFVEEVDLQKNSTSPANKHTEG